MNKKTIDVCESCKGAKELECDICKGTGGIPVSYPGGGESLIRCDICRGNGTITCFDCKGSGFKTTRAIRDLHEVFNLSLLWITSRKKNKVDSTDDWNSGPLYIYETNVNGQLYEIQSIGDVAPFYRLLIDGKTICDFEISKWPNCWEQPK